MSEQRGEANPYPRLSNFWKFPAGTGIWRISHMMWPDLGLRQGKLHMFFLLHEMAHVYFIYKLHSYVQLPEGSPNAQKICRNRYCQGRQYVDVFC